jgi:hypothetical protein
MHSIKDGHLPMPYHNLLYCVFLLEFLLVDLLGHLVGNFELEIRIKFIEKLLDEYLQALVLIQYQ